MLIFVSFSFTLKIFIKYLLSFFMSKETVVLSLFVETSIQGQLLLCFFNEFVQLLFKEVQYSFLMCLVSCSY